MDKLLQRSAEYEKIVLEQLNYPLYKNTNRARISRIMCCISFEHAESLKILLATRNFTSALGLLRLQYEALVRSVWVYYAASDIVVEKLDSELTVESSKNAEKLPMLSEMLRKLEGKAPKNALDPLLEFKEYSWKPLCSYVHGGIHVLDRHSKGYPVELLKQTLKASNGVSGMAGYFIAILSGIPELAKNFHDTFFKFKDCLPDHKKHL